MTDIYIDIETIPTQDPELLADIASRIKPPGNMKKEETIAKWEAEEKPALVAEAIASAGLNAETGQIVCICIAVDDDKVVDFVATDTGLAEERRILRGAFSVLDMFRPPTRIIGHNIVGFDIPYIWKRAIVHGIKPPMGRLPRNPKPWSDSVLDTMTAWAGDRNHIGLDRLCKVLGIPGKQGMTGADVWPAIQRGEFDKVAAYCAADVEAVRKVARRLEFVNN